jgi:hypothetical protein
LPRDEHRVAKLVRPIRGRVERCGCIGQRDILLKGAQQLEVTAARFVRPGEKCIDDG